MLDGLFGSGLAAQYTKNNDGRLVSSSNIGQGTGTSAYYKDANGNFVGMDPAAAKAYTDAGGSDLTNAADMSAMTSGMGGFLGGIDTLAKLGNVGVGLANYGLAKDTYKFNVMNANRNYEADKTKYNNAVARTEAVNAVYGSPNVATKL